MLANVIRPNQHRFGRSLLFSRLRHRHFQLVLAEEIIGDQRAKFRGGFGRELILLLQGRAEVHGQLLDLAFVVRREPGRALLVDELDHAGKALVRWRMNGDREDLLSAQPAPLVPGAVKREVSMEAREFPLVIRIGDVEATPMPGDKPHNTLIVERDPNLSHLVEIGEARIDFLALGVHGVEGEPFGVKQAKNFVVERHQNLVHLFGRMDMVDDELEPFVISGLFFEGREPGSTVTQVFHDAPFRPEQQVVSHARPRVVNVWEAPSSSPYPVFGLASVLEDWGMNLAHTFWQRLQQEDSTVVLERLEPEGIVSWRQTRSELRTEASHWMAALRAAGIGPGDRVAVSLGKSTGLITAHLAILGVGASVVPLNPALTARETEAVLQRAEVRLAISHAETVSRAPEILTAVQGPWWIVGNTSDLPDRITPLADALAGHRPGLEPIERHDDDVALLLFTSGTTGTPKGVGLTHKNLRANLQALLVETWEMTDRDRLLHALPPHHLHGLGLGIYGSLHVGNTVVFLERFDPAVVLRAFDPHRISVFMGVPTMYHRLLDVDARVTLSSMRVFTCGSAPLSPETFRRFQERFGFTIVERYGLTETAINTSNPLRGPWKPGSVGPTLPGVEVGIFDPQTQKRLSAGETGEIWVRGPNVFSGYWNNPEATAATFHHDWFRTGDLGVIDGDGYVAIRGRIKELIIVGGTNVTPGEVEAVLETDPGVAECAVAGLPDPDLGERIAAFIVPRPGEQAAVLEQRLRAKVEHDLAPYKRPRLYRFLETIPRNAMGKIERSKLRD